MDNNKTTIGRQAPGGNRRGLAWRTIIYLLCLGVCLVIIAACAQNSVVSPTATNRAPANTSPVASPTQTGATTAEGYFQQGNELVKQGQLEAAVAAYQKAIELDPNYQAVYANLGVVYYQLEQLDLAAQQYEKALELNPDDGEVTYNLGALNLQRALINGGQPDSQLLDQAILRLQHAQELSPDLAEPYFTLGVAYFYQNEKAKAIEAFETFLARDTGRDPQASAEAQDWLDRLNSE